LNKICSRFKPATCNTLHSDELFLKLLHRFLYVWDSCTKDSKWLTIRPSLKRNSKSAEHLLQESPRPLEANVTDGAFSYTEPVRKVHGRQVKHIVATDDHKYLNNFIEGVQSTIRRFTRPRRGFKRIHKAVNHLRRYQHYHNFIKNNVGLGNKPPAVRLGFVHYPNKANKKQRILHLLNQALSFWQKIKHRLC